MSNWLDRLNINSAPGQSPLVSRPYSPAPVARNSLQLPPTRPQQPVRPSLQTRSTSLNLLSTLSLPAAARVPSSLKNQLAQVPEVDVVDPLVALETILGISPKKPDVTVDVLNTDEEDVPEVTRNVSTKPENLVENIEFGDLSLQDFIEQNAPRHAQRVFKHNVQSVAEYETERKRFEELHTSIASCDETLQSVEKHLSIFQVDLGTVSAEIETLQARSAALSGKLDVRKEVEKLLGPVIERISIPPAVVKKISEGPIDDAWVDCLEDLQRYAKSFAAEQESPDIKAVEDVKPLIEDLSTKAVERIRDHFAIQIRALRAAGINAQVNQQNQFLRYKSLYAFMAKKQPQLGAEIAQAYANTMRWYYSSHFTQYHAALSKLKILVTDNKYVLGEDTTASARSRAANTGPPHDPYTIGRRLDVLRNPTRTAIPTNAAEESKTSHNLETPFLAYNLALIDNASFEYTFLTSLFHPAIPMSSLNKHFATIFSPVLTLGTTLTRTLITETYDGIGVLLLVRLNQHSAFTLQRRRIPTLDSYINGTSMLLWPRFQLILDAHCDSLRRAASALPTRPAGGGASSAAALLIGGGSSNASAASTAPHPLTQRFSSFVYAVLELSADAGDDIEPVENSLSRLRTEYEAFLAKLALQFGPGERGKKDRERMLANNYSLCLAVLAGARGRLAEAWKVHFERLVAGGAAVGGGRR